MLGRLVGTVPIMTIHTSNGLVHIVDTHMVPEKENPDKTQPTGDIKLEDIVCVFPLKKDVIRIQWRRKNDAMPLYHHDFMFVRDFKLDLKSMYPDKKLRKNACPILCKKIIEQINAHHGRNKNDGWFVLQQYEKIEKSFPARTKHGKGTAYLTNLGISFEHESKGVMFWMGYKQLISWSIHKSRSVRLEHEYVFKWKNTGKQELLVTDFDLRVEDDTDPQLLCDIIHKCFADSGVDATRDREQIKDMMQTWKPKDFLDYGTYGWCFFYHTFFEEKLQEAFRGRDKFLQSKKLSEKQKDEKIDISKKYQRYCLWYVREKILAEYTPVTAVHRNNQFVNCKTYPRIENNLADLLIRCHALSIPVTDKVFEFSDAFKATLQKGNRDVHIWSKENDICLNHVDRAEVIAQKYENLGELQKVLDDREFLFHYNQSKKHSLKQFANKDWINKVETTYCDYDTKYTMVLDDDGNPARSVDKPSYYSRNLTWTEPYHSDAVNHIFDVMYRNMYDIWKQTHPLTDFESDYDMSWMDYQIDNFPYGVAEINFENELFIQSKTRPYLKSIRDKYIADKKRLDSFVTPDNILESDILSPDCFYHYKDKIWFTRNPDVIPLLEDVATVSKDECESRYGFVGLGFSDKMVQMIDDRVPAVMCSESAVAKLEFVKEPAPIMLKFITEKELTISLIERFVAGSIYFPRLSLEYCLTNDGNYMVTSYRWAELRTMQRNGTSMLPLAERIRRSKFYTISAQSVYSGPADFACAAV